MSVNPEAIQEAKTRKDQQSSIGSSDIDQWTPGQDFARPITDPTVIERTVEVTRLGGSYRIIWRGDEGYFAQGEVSYPPITESFTIREYPQDDFNGFTDIPRIQVDGVGVIEIHNSPTDIDLDERYSYPVTTDRLDRLNLFIYNPEGDVLSSVQPDKETWDSLGIELLLSEPRNLTTLMIQTPQGYTFRVQTAPDAEAGPSRLMSLEQDLPENDPSGGSLRLDEGGSLALIKRDPLTGVQLEEFFDGDFYLASNPDVAEAVANGGISDPLTHFQRHGQYEGRNPNGFFDTAFYLASNPDVAAGVAEGSVESAVTHFINHGQFDWRSPNPGYSDFAYLVRNREVLDALEAGEFTTPVAHFLEVGQDRGFSAIPLA